MPGSNFEYLQTPHYTITSVEHDGAIDGRYYPFTNSLTGVNGLSMIIEIAPAAGVYDPNFKFIGSKFEPPVEILPLHEVKGDKALYFDMSTEHTGDDAKKRLEAARLLIEAVLNVAEDPFAYLSARYSPQDAPAHTEES